MRVRVRVPDPNPNPNPNQLARSCACSWSKGSGLGSAALAACLTLVDCILPTCLAVAVTTPALARASASTLPVGIRSKWSVVSSR